MIFELLFLILLIFGIAVIAYRGAIHEFQILQKDYTPQANWTEMMNEQLPIVIRGLPKHWLGNWAHAKTANKTWQLVVQGQDQKKFKTTWNVWLQTPNNTTPVSLETITDVIKLRNNFEHWAAEGFHQWYTVPTQTPTAYIYQQQDVMGLRKGIADFTAIVSTDGNPLELWIAHEGAIPANVADDIMGKDPWIQTTKEIPWIGDVKYIEIKLRPGNTVLLPRHWWYAIRAAKEKAEQPLPTYAWFWKGEIHSPVSWITGKIRRD
jgi:hypothetical protein